MWPKNSCGLQLRVIVCVILLVAVRVINVIVPLLTKEISKYISKKRMALLEPYLCMINCDLFWMYLYIICTFSWQTSWEHWKNWTGVLLGSYPYIRLYQVASRWGNREPRTFEYYASISVDKDTAIHYTGDSSKNNVFKFWCNLIALDEFKTILLEV